MDSPQVRYVTTKDEYRIAYTVDGFGPPLVLMPHAGFGLYARRLQGRRNQIARLAERYRVVCYDMRGMGLSTRGLPSNFSWRETVRDLEAVAFEVSDEPLVLWARFAAVSVAIAYAAAHPERVAGLVLEIPGPAGIPNRGRNWEAFMGLAEQPDWDFFLELTARSAMPLEDGLVAKQMLKDTATQADYVAELRSHESPSVEPMLPEVRAPTLILTYADGAYVFPSLDASQELAASISGSKLVIFESFPGAIRSAVDEFFATLHPANPTNAFAPTSLSLREVEVLRLIAEGRSNAQIGEALVISPHTVGRHAANIFAKTGTANRAEAAAFAARHGLL